MVLVAPARGPTAPWDPPPAPNGARFKNHLRKKGEYSLGVLYRRYSILSSFQILIPAVCLSFFSFRPPLEFFFLFRHLYKIVPQRAITAQFCFSQMCSSYFKLLLHQIKKIDWCSKIFHYSAVNT